MKQDSHMCDSWYRAWQTVGNIHSIYTCSHAAIPTKIFSHSKTCPMMLLLTPLLGEISFWGRVTWNTGRGEDTNRETHQHQLIGS